MGTEFYVLSVPPSANNYGEFEPINKEPYISIATDFDHWRRIEPFPICLSELNSDRTHIYL